MMQLDTNLLGIELKKYGFTFFSGVPCSYLKDLINYAINESEFVMATNEGEAVAISSGAYLGGKKSVVLMQNSGLTNAVSPLTSLNYTFKIPILGFVSLRGEPHLNDEPQHELMGVITEKMLDIMEIKWEYLSNNEAEFKKQMKKANDYIEKNESFFFIVKHKTLSKVQLKEKLITHTKNIVLEKEKPNKNLTKRENVLKVLTKNATNDTIFLATTGKVGRELYEIKDRHQNLYMVGSMGCVSSLGLGLSLSKKDKKIIAIDGDGALLMRMGNLATNGYYAKNNLLHVMIDNNAHDSTGGQKTISSNVDFASVASNCGYEASYEVYSLENFEKLIKLWIKNPIKTFITIHVKIGTKENLGRPKIKPFEVKERLMEYLHG